MDGNGEQKTTKGLRCPDCNCCDLRAYYTRKQLSRIKRVRICRHCGRRIVTFEKQISAD